ncbi:hypothetical protein JW992_06990 [candidate division KSB1 bacterium]|nr:hypothetical protein [candidate division KSB1 bacterium]
MILWRLLIAFLALTVLTAQADNPSSTNAQQLDRLISRALERIPESALVEGNPLLIVRPLRRDGLAPLFDQRLGEWALQRGAKNIRFLASEPENEINGSVLHAHILNTDVHYRTRQTGDILQRSVGLSLQFSVFDDDKQLLWAESIRDSLVDELEVGRIARIEDPTIPATVGIKPDSSHKQKWIEPLLVSAVSAVVIYLFYTYRSH